jgi:hypothetical protein
MKNLTMLSYPLYGVKVKYLEYTDIFREITGWAYARGICTGHLLQREKYSHYLFRGCFLRPVMIPVPHNPGKSG